MQDGDILTIPDELLEALSAPRECPWSEREKAYLRKLYPIAARNRTVKTLVEAWEGLTGTPRTYAQISSKAQAMSLQGGNNGPAVRP